MTRIAVTGLSGVIGSVLLRDLMKPDVDLIDLYHRQPIVPANHPVQVDLSSPQDLERRLDSLQVDTIIHLAAATHIDYCEQDRKHGQAGFVWQTNVEATRVLVEYCHHHPANLIFLSTECVFDGERAYYEETAEPSPKNWYGETKAKAEDYVRSLGSNGAIIRAAIAYHRDDASKTLLGKFLNLYQKNQPFSAVSDQSVTFTHTPDITKAIMVVLQRNLSGVFHVSTNQEMSPHEFAQAVALAYHHDPSLVKPVSMTEYLGEQRAKLRLRHASLNGSASQQVLGYIPRTVAEVLS